MYDPVGKMKCFLCSEEADRLPHQGLEHHLYCKNCGEYKITIQAERVLEYTQEDIRYILSSQTFENYYYEDTPLTLLSEHIQNAKDISLWEKLYKLSKYLYHETKKKNLGTEIKGIKHLQFYCKNDIEYFQLLETLKSMNIIDFKKIDNPGGVKSTPIVYYGHPKLLGPAMLTLEEGIDNIEDFKRIFMTTKKDGNQFTTSINGEKIQFNLATDNSKITAYQNNSLDIAELNTLIENIVKALPQNISDEKRNEVTENLEFIKTEIQSPNPRKTIIKTIFSALKGVATTAGFLASLAKLAEFLQL
jgi:hypothetical protein